MRIVDLEQITLRGPALDVTAHPAWAPGEIWTHHGAAIIKVQTDEGITGLGVPGYGPSTSFESWVKPRLLGKDPFLVEQHVKMLRQAGECWGVEIALWDIIGKACGQPLYKLWGGHADKVPGYASFIESRTPERRADDALRVREAGYRAVKLRFHAWELKQDLAQAAAVCGAVGDSLAVLVDANQAMDPGTTHAEPGPVWSELRALQTARELQRMGAYWLEEPLDRYNFEGLARLCAAVDLAIAGGENNHGFHEFRQIVEGNVYDIIQPEALVSEGLGQLRKIAALAEMHHKIVAPHNGGGGIGMAAHLHLLASIPNGSYLEMMHDPPCMTSDQFQWYLKEPLRIDAEGYVYVPGKPGLGIELDDDIVQRYRVQ